MEIGRRGEVVVMWCGRGMLDVGVCFADLGLV